MTKLEKFKVKMSPNDRPRSRNVFLGQPQVKLPTVLMHWLLPQGLVGPTHSSLSTHWLKYRCSWNPCRIRRYREGKKMGLQKTNNVCFRAFLASIKEI